VGRFLLPGWTDSDGIREMLRGAECGCMTESEAAKDADPTSRQRCELDAIGEKIRWRCPRVTGENPPADSEWMDGTQSLVLEGVERLTGACGFTTCPVWYASLDYVHEAVRAYEWWDKGQLHLIEPNPSGVLVDAIGLIGRGIADRQRDDFERMKRDSEKRVEDVRRKREQ
jgi:hypothetical protein